MTVVAFVTMLPAYLLWTLRCDESCAAPEDTASAEWSQVEDAWQWDAQFAVAVIGLVAALVALGLLGSECPRAHGGVVGGRGVPRPLVAVRDAVFVKFGGSYLQAASALRGFRFRVDQLPPAVRERDLPSAAN